MSDYLKIPKKLKDAVRRGKYHLVVELYHHSVDDIFSNPAAAMFRYATVNLTWQGSRYLGKLDTQLTFDKFINKQFNTLSFNLLNVSENKNRPSFIVLNTVIKGFRVNIRVIAKGLSIEDSWSVWSGRLDSISELSREVVGINCTQELGKFSYQVATDHYGQGCPLRYGRDECLGYETFEQKSPTYKRMFQLYGHGGCNKTWEACVQRENTKFYQGQRKLTTGGTFIRTTYIKKRNWWTLGLTKKKKKTETPVQWSPKNQDDNSNITIPLGFGRISTPSRMFTSADIGGSLIGLVGFIRPSIHGIEGFYAVKSGDETFPVTSYTEHWGQYGGLGNQLPDPRFTESGYNSRLAYLGVTCADLSEDPLADQPQEFPTISSILKASRVPIFNGEDWAIDWTHNPVWITRYLMTDFRFPVIKDAWFNDQKNFETAKRCYRIVEDDTNSDIAVISDNEVENFNDGSLVRFHSAGRFNYYYTYNGQDYPIIPNRSENLLNSGQSLLLPQDPTIGQGDIDFFPVLANGGNNLRKTFLQFQFTFNGIINETSSLSDVLYGLLLPTFRGYISFDRYAQIFIGMRTPAPNAFVRTDFDLSSNSEPSVLPITNVSKLHNKGGKLLIGAGQINGEVRTDIGVRFIHSPIKAAVSTGGSLTATVTNFIEQSSAPSRCVLQFAGTPTVGERIELKFTTPIVNQTQPHVLSWDWYVENVDSTETVAAMFKARLEASPTFNEFWTVRINEQNKSQLVIDYQAGFLLLNKPLKFNHEAGEEVLRVVEVYENFKDESNTDGTKDNIFEFSIAQGDDVYQSVKGTYTSAIEDFSEVEILPRSAWDTIEDEREMNLLELDLRGVDNYNQAGFLVKANYIDFVIAALYGNLAVPDLAMFHQEDDVIAVRYQTIEGAVTYLPMSIIALAKAADSVQLRTKLYMSAMFDERVPQEEKFLESTLTTPSEDTSPNLTNNGGFSSTRTGDGAADSPQDILYPPKPYGVLPKRFHTDGSYSEMTDYVYSRRPKVFVTGETTESLISTEGFSRNDFTRVFIPAPINLQITSLDLLLGTFTLTYSWVQNLDSVEYFLVRVRNSSGALVATYPTTEFIINIAVPLGDSYTIDVKANTAKGASKWSESVSVSIAEYLTDDDGVTLTTDTDEDITI